MSGFVVYRIYDGDTGALLYIGYTGSPERRIKSHRRKEWWPSAPYVTVEEFDTWEAAYGAEGEALRAEKPRHNKPRPAPLPMPVFHPHDPTNGPEWNRSDVAIEAAS